MAENRSNRWVKWTIVIVAAIAVIAGGIWYFKRGHTNAPNYQTVAVTRGELAGSIRLHVPSEMEKRHGQAMAAASLPAIPELRKRGQENTDAAS